MEKIKSIKDLHKYLYDLQQCQIAATKEVLLLRKDVEKLYKLYKGRREGWKK